MSEHKIHESNDNVVIVVNISNKINLNDFLEEDIMKYLKENNKKYLELFSIEINGFEEFIENNFPAVPYVTNKIDNKTTELFDIILSTESYFFENEKEILEFINKKIKHKSYVLFICAYKIQQKIFKKIEEINNKHVYEFHNQYNNNAFLEFNAFLKFKYISEITKLYINKIEYSSM